MATQNDQCGDPDCTEEHGDETPDSESMAVYEQSRHSMNERMRKR